MQRIASLGLGKLAILVTMASVLFVLFAFGQEMFSAGPLSVESRKQVGRGGVNAHAQITRCSACHAPAWSSETMSMRCLDCHQDIRIQIDGAKAMHGQLAKGQDCKKCHTEHKGPHGDLTSFVHFDHDFTDFKLVGNHKKAECAACHADKAYQGTPQTCVACHAEPTVHKGKFGINCMTCHATTEWNSTALNKETLIAIKFDHDTAAFKLTGKHKSVDCKSCHSGSGFKGTPQTCVSCHAEPPSHKPHPKSFGTDCAQCHSTLAWKGAALVKHTFPMNHRTKNRQNSACAVCHPATISNVATGTGLVRSYATYTCYGCHHTQEKEARRHANRKVADLNSCAKCHPYGRGDKRRTALDGAFEFALCHSGPEASECPSIADDFCPTSCRSIGAGECATAHESTGTLLRSLASLSKAPNRLAVPQVRTFEASGNAISTSDRATPRRLLWTTHPALNEGRSLADNNPFALPAMSTELAHFASQIR